MSSRLGTTLPGCFSARNPPGPTSLAWSAHPSLQTPSYAGELGSATAGKKTFSRSQNWSGNSGFLIPSPVAFQPIFITCPGRRREVGTKANSPLSFPWETFRGSRLILTVSPPWPVPGTLTGAGPAFKDLWGFGLCAIYVFPGWSSRVLMPFKRAR